MSTRLARVMADVPLDATIENLLHDHVEVVPWAQGSGPADNSIQGIYTYGHVTVDGAVLDQCPQVKVISNYGVGVDHINLAEAAARSIPVGNTPGVLEEATADLGFALLLASARRIVAGDQHAHSAQFVRFDPGFMLGREVHGKTLGVIGLGRIGQQVARRAIGFDMTVLYHNRRRRPDVERDLSPSVNFVERDILLARSDYVMLCVPLTDETRGSIGARELALMKPDATLINIARGAVVDTTALAEAIAGNCIAAAALDVTDPEPLPRDHPLLAMPQVIITPHLGSATVETRRRMAELSVGNLLAGLRGDPLPYRV
jgi:glyoxylate reductase